MRVKTNSYKIRFKKRDAETMLVWLSGLVHVLAQIEKQAGSALIIQDHPLEVATPACAEVEDPDHLLCDDAAFYTADLPALKAARRKVAAAVRLERMP